MGERPGNRRSGRQAIATAAAVGAGLVVLPELSDTGCVLTDRDEAVAVADPGPTAEGWVEAARQFDGVHLWGRQPEVFAPGTTTPPVVDTLIVPVGVLVCCDPEFPERVQLDAEGGADVVAAPANLPLTDRLVGELPIAVVKAQAAAAHCGVHVVVADGCGHDRGTRWIGGACIVDRTGYVAARPSLEDAPTLVTADLDAAAARDKLLGSCSHLVGDRSPDLYS